MSPKLDIARVESCLEWVEKSAEDYTAQQSIAWFTDHLGTLCNALAFVNGQMAVAKKEMNEAKVRAYNSLITSEAANQMYFAPSLAKDYINGKLATETYHYDVCERASRTLTHTIEAVRTCISALKQEAKIAGYHQQPSMFSASYDNDVNAMVVQ